MMRDLAGTAQPSIANCKFSLNLPCAITIVKMLWNVNICYVLFLCCRFFLFFRIFFHMDDYCCLSFFHANLVVCECSISFLYVCYFFYSAIFKLRGLELRHFFCTAWNIINWLNRCHTGIHIYFRIKCWSSNTVCACVLYCIAERERERKKNLTKIHTYQQTLFCTTKLN